MIKLLIPFILVIAIITGCSDNQDDSKTETSDGWDFNGYVIEKTKGSLLIAWNITKEEVETKNVSEILDIAKPNAIRINYEDTKDFAVGNKVFVWTTGNINDSYPKQGTATKVELDKSE